MFKMHSLKRLHEHLDQMKISKLSFDYKIREALFRAMYISDIYPFELSLVPVGLRPKETFFLLWKFDENFYTDPSINNDEYYKLARMLRYDGSSENKLIPFVFLRELDDFCKSCRLPSRKLTPEEIVAARPDIEERDKPYFCGWMQNNERLGRPRNVTSENLKKTATILGNKAKIFSKRENISSVWSHDPLRAKDWKSG
ncbi:MAG: DUF6037 family protein [Pseudomonadota bacterium]